MPPSQLVQVSLPGTDGLLATFLDEPATARQLVVQLLNEDGARISQSILASSQDEIAATLDSWAIQHCITSKPNAERTEQELQQLEERAS